MDHFPSVIKELKKFDGHFDGYVLEAENCEVIFASYPKGTVIEPHDHPTDNHSVVTKGKITFDMNGKEHLFQTGDWILVPTGTQHAARTEEDTHLIEFWFKKP